MAAAPLTGACGAIRIFYSSYYGYRDAFHTVLDSFHCVIADKDA